jgi:2-polyprenyl-6-methoxyphenol hydroxylase-like FAD-dependent oxidoreductase
MVGRVVPMLDRRGLHERFGGTSGPPAPVPSYVFAAFRLDQSDLADRPIYSLKAPQHRVEQVFAERAAELGVEVRRGQEVTGLSQDEQSVTIGIAGGSRSRRPSRSVPTVAAARSARPSASTSPSWPGTRRSGGGGG